VADIKAGQIVEGGSTITQQLVRNLYISREKTVQRKVKEACLATKLDARGASSASSPTYLNQVYYGNHAYGIEAAAQTYFSKPASDLDLSESALLAGLTQAPSIYDPFTAPAGARRAAGGARAMLDTHVITPRHLPQGPRREGRPAPGSSTTRSASRTSSATYATSSSRRTGASQVRLRLG
jgi:penicillin-binding protein 1A